MNQVEIIRNNLIDKLHTINNENVLKAIHTLLEESTNTAAVFEFNNQQLEELKQSEGQIEQGLVIRRNEVISRAKEWVKKR